MVDVVISQELTNLEICLTGDTFSNDLKGRMLSHAMATTTRQHEYMEILANILNWYTFNGEPDVMCEEEIYFNLLNYGTHHWADRK